VYLRGSLPALVAFVASGCTATTGTTEGAATAAGPGRGGNLIKNADFESGSSLPWTPSFNARPRRARRRSTTAGTASMVDNKGAAPWDAQVRHREMVIQKGHRYVHQLQDKADQPTRVRSKVGRAGPPYTEYWVKTLEIGPEPQTITGDFTMNGADDPTAEWAFHGGGTMALPAGNFTFCIDDVFLTGSRVHPTATAAARQVSPLRVQPARLPPLGRQARDPGVGRRDARGLGARRRQREQRAQGADGAVRDRS
jgi:endoglucanase